MTAVDTPRARAEIGTVPLRPAQPRPERRPGRHLKPVTKPARDPRTRNRPGAPVLVGTGIVIVALFALAAMHALLIGGQLRLDDAQRAAASETEEIRALRLRVAELESPGRVLDVARERLGMVEPSEVGYLLPGSVDTGDDGPIRVAPAEAPPPPEPEPDPETDPETVSPEQQAVDAASVDAGSVDTASTTPESGEADAGDDHADTQPTTDAAPDAPSADGGNE